MDSTDDFGDQEQTPTNRLVVSARAALWLDGMLDSADYFSIARRQAYKAARREVGARLQRTPWFDRDFAGARHPLSPVGDEFS